MPTTEQLAEWLAAIGCPREKSLEMAAQLEKRARQLAVRKNRTDDEALAHLLDLMKQGWAAKEQLGSDELLKNDSALASPPFPSCGRLQDLHCPVRSENLA